VKVVIRQRARDDLDKIVRWIALDNPHNAISVATCILDVIESKIVLFPRLGRSGRILGTREWVMPGLPYIIVYKVNDIRDALVILAVFHGVQNR
jgi:plasmid stabilization system protein ParE